MMSMKRTSLTGILLAVLLFNFEVLGVYQRIEVENSLRRFQVGVQGDSKFSASKYVEKMMRELIEKCPKCKEEFGELWCDVMTPRPENHTIIQLPEYHSVRKAFVAALMRSPIEVHSNLNKHDMCALTFIQSYIFKNSLTRSQGELVFEYIGNALAEFSTTDDLRFLQLPARYDMARYNICMYVLFVGMFVVRIARRSYRSIKAYMSILYEHFHQLNQDEDEKLEDEKLDGISQGRLDSKWLEEHTTINNEGWVEDCPICYDDIAPGQRYVQCIHSHRIHSSCLDKWMRTQPMDHRFRRQCTQCFQEFTRPNETDHMYL
jgi:hypothetical protein